MNYPDSERIQKIYAFAKELNDYIKAHGVTENDILNDVHLQWLITTPLSNIGEHAYYLSSEYKEKHADIPWDLIAGLRHRLVHDYDGTNWEMISDVIMQDLPKLEEQIAPLIDAGQP